MYLRLHHDFGTGVQQRYLKLVLKIVLRAGACLSVGQRICFLHSCGLIRSHMVAAISGVAWQPLVEKPQGGSLEEL